MKLPFVAKIDVPDAVLKLIFPETVRSVIVVVARVVVPRTIRFPVII